MYANCAKYTIENRSSSLGSRRVEEESDVTALMGALVGAFTRLTAGRFR